MNNNFRDHMKKEIASHIFAVETKDKQQSLEKYDLGIRILKFLQYEQDKEFEEWFDNFCRRKIKEKEEEENEKL